MMRDLNLTRQVTVLFSSSLIRVFLFSLLVPMNKLRSFPPTDTGGGDHETKNYRGTYENVCHTTAVLTIWKMQTVTRFMKIKKTSNSYGIIIIIMRSGENILTNVGAVIDPRAQPNNRLSHVESICTKFLEKDQNKLKL